MPRPVPSEGADGAERGAGSEELTEDAEASSAPAGGSGPAPTFSGAVLTGGASRRMGQDKALVEVEPGQTLALVAAEALRASGAQAVTVIGGDQEALEAAGLSWAPDRHPGAGPLGGIITALAEAATDLVVVLACDMPGITAEVPRRLVTTLAGHPEAGVCLAVAAGRQQPLTACWRRSVALVVLEAAFAAGERAPRRTLDDVGAVGVDDLPPEQLVDVDSPADLRRYADRHPVDPRPPPG